MYRIWVAVLTLVGIAVMVMGASYEADEISNSNAIKVTGGRLVIQGSTVPASGAGMELSYDGSTTCGVTCYDRTGTAYKDLAINALKFRVMNSGSEYLTLTDGKLGVNDSSPSYRLEVNGTSHVTGEFTAGTKTFMIDHPTDPYNKFLYHATVEAPRHDLIYRGTVKLKKGEATVDIDAESGMTSGTFDALTQNALVVSLQNQDSFDRVKPGTVSNGSFTITCENDKSTDDIAWVVMAERADPMVKWSSMNDADGHLIVEKDKLSPSEDELALLEKDVIETDIESKQGKSEQVPVDILSKRKGYLMQPECRGEERPKKTREYKAKKEQLPKE